MSVGMSQLIFHLQRCRKMNLVLSTSNNIANNAFQALIFDIVFYICQDMNH